MMLDSSRSDNFIHNTTFENVLNVYLFDKQLRLLCLRALESIEMSVRTNIAHSLGRISPIAHFDKNNFDQQFIEKNDKTGKEKRIHYEKWLDKYNLQLRIAHKTPFIKHHTDNYTNVPIWVGIEVLDFGSISVLYSGLKGAQQRKIAQLYSINKAKTFESWLKSLNYIRNICAHHGRLWNANIDVIARIDRNISGLSSADNKRLFFYLLMMKHLLNIINPNSMWGDEVRQLLLDFPEPNNGAVSLDGLGFTQWVDWTNN